MIRSSILIALTVFASTSLAFATTPAEPLPPLRPTKAPEQAEPFKPEGEAKPQERPSRRKTFTTNTREKAPDPAPPETGTKGRVHVPSKAVKHDSARDPANQKPPETPGAYDAPYNN